MAICIFWQHNKKIRQTKAKNKKQKVSSTVFWFGAFDPYSKIH
jgi:hypothetical protein